jgi:hypothetical protein
MRDKVINARDFFLVRFWGKHDEGSPWTATLMDSVIADGGFNMGHSAVGLVSAVRWLWAANWGGDACVDSELEA